MRKIDEEDAADAAKRAAQQAATRQYIADFLKQQVQRCSMSIPISVTRISCKGILHKSVICL